jgi:hypothetical protein
MLGDERKTLADINDERDHTAPPAGDAGSFRASRIRSLLGLEDPTL